MIDKAIGRYPFGPNYSLKNGDPLFELARYVRTVEGCYSIRFGPNFLWEVFNRWVDRNRDHLEPDHDYHTDFLDKLTQVKFAMGEGLGSLLAAARRTALPTRAKHLCPLAQDLARLCQALTGKNDGTFYLGCTATACGLLIFAPPAYKA